MVDTPQSGDPPFALQASAAWRGRPGMYRDARASVALTAVHGLPAPGLLVLTAFVPTSPVLVPIA